MSGQERRTVRISLLQHRKTGLLLAVSPDLAGLMVPGRSEDELLGKIPAAIQELLEADGIDVILIEQVRRSPEIPEDFIPPAYVADAIVRSAV